MKIKFLMKIILLSCLLCSCGINKNDVHSIYGTYATHIQTCLYRFDINENGTFCYLSGYGSGIHYNSYGTWQLSKNGRKIIFDSYKSLDSLNAIPVVVTESKWDNDKTLIIFDKPMMSFEESFPQEFERRKKYPDKNLPNGYGEYDSLYYNVVINDTIKYPVYSDSIFVSSQIKIENFYFTMRGYFEEMFIQPQQDTAITQKYYIKDTSNNVFKVSFDFPKFKWRDLFFCVPVHDTLRLKRNALYWKNAFLYGKGTLKMKKTSNVSD